MYCRKKFLVTEEERKHILSLYDLISEAEETNKLDVEGQSFFEDGYWSKLSQKGEIEFENIMSTKVIPFLQNAANSLISIKIISSESIVPNYDAEDKTTPQRDKEELPSGTLAKRRGETMKKILSEYVVDLKNKNLISNDPIFEPVEIVPPTQVPYRNDPKNPKYAKDRYVKFQIRIISTEECLTGLKINVFYKKDIDPKYPCFGGHKCDLAYFYVKVNGVPIGMANLNNQKDGGDRSSGDIILTTDLARKIIASNPNATDLTITLQCASGSNCHSSTPAIRIIDKYGVERYNKCAPYIKNTRGDTNDKLLMVINPCGEVKKVGNDQDIVTGDTEYLFPTYSEHNVDTFYCAFHTGSRLNGRKIRLWEKQNGGKSMKPISTFVVKNGDKIDFYFKDQIYPNPFYEEIFGSKKIQEGSIDCVVKMPQYLKYSM